MTEPVLAPDPLGGLVPAGGRRVGGGVRDGEQVVDHRPEDAEQLAGVGALGREVVDVQLAERIDGLKLLFGDGSWVLMRPSGTEPVVRYYAESTSKADLDTLLEYGRQWITEA